MTTNSSSAPKATTPSTAARSCPIHCGGCGGIIRNSAVGSDRRPNRERKGAMSPCGGLWRRCVNTVGGDRAPPKNGSRTRELVSPNNERRRKPKGRGLLAGRSGRNHVLLFPGVKVAVRFGLHLRAAIGESVGFRPFAVRRLPGLPFANQYH